MHEKLNNKRHLRLVTTTPISPLTLNERLAYSALLSHADGQTQEGVSSITGLDAKGTVAASLNFLAGHTLADKQSRRWVALEPKEERARWFYPGPKGMTWQTRFSYTKLYERSPNCPLTTRQNVIFCTLLSLAAKTSDRKDLPQACQGRICDKLTFEYLSLITGTSTKTVTKTIDLLADLKLVRSFPSSDRSKFALALLEPPDEALSWFLDKEVEVYPGLAEFLSGNDYRIPEKAALDLPVVVPNIDHDAAERAAYRKAAKRSKAPAAKPSPLTEPHQAAPEHKAEPEILPLVPDPLLETGGVIERLHRQAAERRQQRERDIEAILLGFGYDVGVADKLCKEFDEPCLPQFDAYMAMIYDAEATFQKNKAEGKYARVRTSELLLFRRLADHRKQAMENHERAVQAHDLRAFRQRASLVGRAALERPWEDYEDPLSAPFDARLFAERIDGGELRWDSWGRAYGEEACRRALLGLPRVRIDEVLVEDGRMEPDEFLERLKAISPPRPRPKKLTEEEMYEALKSEMDAA